MTLGDNDYLADRRYYWPLVPLSVFVVYSFASLTDVPKRSGLTRMLQTFGVVYLTGYVAMSLAYIVFFFVPGEHGTNQRQKLMASELRHWPSMAVTFEFSPARRLVMRLLKEQPNTLLLTSKAGWFYWDPTVDRSRLYQLNEFDCKNLQATYLSGPAHIVILTFDNGGPQELWYHRRMHNDNLELWACGLCRTVAGPQTAPTLSGRRSQGSGGARSGGYACQSGVVTSLEQKVTANAKSELRFNCSGNCSPRAGNEPSAVYGSPERSCSRDCFYQHLSSGLYHDISCASLYLLFYSIPRIFLGDSFEGRQNNVKNRTVLLSSP